MDITLKSSQMKIISFSIACVFSFQTYAAVVEVGKVRYARGVLTGQVEGESPRIMGRGLPLHNGETLNTGKKSFAVISLKDGTKMTLRPNTTFKIENVNTKRKEENIFLRLLRGGFRAITGSISKKDPKAFRVNTAVATIGIRGTEFDARICDQDECDQENKSNKKSAEQSNTVIGRIALLNGKASATAENLQTRPLSVGAAIYERDQLQTGINSHAVIAFNDKSRVTMSPVSSFKIEEHRYKPEFADENNAFLRFLKGGLRIVSGLIGKLNRSGYRVATPTATIGIRGTGFDLICEGRCSDQNVSWNPLNEGPLAKLLAYFVKPVYAQTLKDGMYAQVWSGTIELILGSGKLILNPGRAAFLRNGTSRPILLPNIPVHLRNMGGAPRPDKVKVDDNLFSSVDQKDIKPGLHVYVRDGDVQLTSKTGSVVNLGKNEAGMTGLDGVSIRLKFVPPFQKFDDIPLPDGVSARFEDLQSLFDGDDGKKFECTVQ